MLRWDPSLAPSGKRSSVLVSTTGYGLSSPAGGRAASSPGTCRAEGAPLSELWMRSSDSCDLSDRAFLTPVSVLRMRSRRDGGRGAAASRGGGDVAPAAAGATAAPSAPPAEGRSASPSR